MNPALMLLLQGKRAITLAYQGSAVDPSDILTSGSYTFAAHGLGAASATRRVIVMGAVRATADVNISIDAVTIGGVSATVTTVLSATQSRTFVAVAHVPTGETGDVVVTVSAPTMLRCAIAVWSASDALAVVASGTAPRNADSPVSLTLASQSGGFVLATLATVDADTGTVAWTGLTERFDRQIGTEAMWWSGGDGPTTGATVTVTADWSVAGATAEDLSVVTIRPA